MNINKQIAYIVPANQLYMMKFALAELINKYQAEDKLNKDDIQNLKTLIQLENNTNLDNFQITYI